MPYIFLAHTQTTLVSPIHAIMAVRAFWERKATMFAAALQRLLALRVKASPIYEHVKEKRLRSVHNCKQLLRIFYFFEE